MRKKLGIRQTWECLECRRIFTDKVAYRQHMEGKHGKKKEGVGRAERKKRKMAQRKKGIESG